MPGLIQNQIANGPLPVPVAQPQAQPQPLEIQRVDPAELDRSQWGKRADGSAKGLGYFGALQRPDGEVSTELSIDMDFGHGDIQIPLLVPTLTRKEIAHLLDGGEPTKEIVDKAARHAIDRMRQSKSPFASDDELHEVPEQ